MSHQLNSWDGKPPGVLIDPPGCYLIQSLVDSLEEISKLEIRPDDIWIVTYPKCGK